MQKVYSPGPSRNVGKHIHGLIFGPKQAQAIRRPRRLLPCLPRPLRRQGQPAAPPATAPAHPFAHNPVYGDILKGLDALGTHLKGVAQPNGRSSHCRNCPVCGVQAPNATDELVAKYAKYQELSQGQDSR